MKTVRLETIQFPFDFVTHEPAQQLVPLAHEHDVGLIAMKPLGGGMSSNANLCIKYLLQFENVVPDPGIQRLEEIEEIAEIVAGPWERMPEEWHAIEHIRVEVGTHFCRRCGYCEPCPQGVRISTVMNMRSLWQRIPAERLASGWPAEATASVSECIECGECEERCPYQLPIREMLVENIAYYEVALRAEGPG